MRTLQQSYRPMYTKGNKVLGTAAKHSYVKCPKHTGERNVLACNECEHKHRIRFNTVECSFGA